MLAHSSATDKIFSVLDIVIQFMHMCIAHTTKIKATNIKIIHILKVGSVFYAISDLVFKFSFSELMMWYSSHKQSWQTWSRACKEWFPWLFSMRLCRGSFIDMLFSYIINDIKENGDLTVRPTLNLDYCLLIANWLYGWHASYWKQWHIPLVIPG